jgi:predicted phosphodiesterase
MNPPNQFSACPGANLALDPPSSGHLGDLLQHAPQSYRTALPRGPIIVLSDLHIGHPASFVTDPTELAPLFRDAGTVIFNGDTFETDLPPAGSSLQGALAALRATLVHEHCEPLFLAGNHDSTITTRRFLELADGALLMTHGDVLHPAIAPWAGESSLTRRRFEEAMAAFDRRETMPDPLLRRLAASRYAAACVGWHRRMTRGPLTRRDARRFWSVYARRPVKALRVLHYWSSLPRLANSFLETCRPRVRCLIIGHSHRAGVWHRRGRTIISTGAFQIMSRPAAVLIEGDVISFCGLRRTRGGWKIERRRAVMTLEGLSDCYRHAA